MHYLAWTWNAWDCKRGPALVTARPPLLLFPPLILRPNITRNFNLFSVSFPSTSLLFLILVLRPSVSSSLFDFLVPIRMRRTARLLLMVLASNRTSSTPNPLDRAHTNEKTFIPLLLLFPLPSASPVDTETPFFSSLSLRLCVSIRCNDVVIYNCE